MQNLEAKLIKAQAALDALLSVNWWTLSKDEEEIYASNIKKAIYDVQELQRRIAATREVRSTARAMRSNTLF